MRKTAPVPVAAEKAKPPACTRIGAADAAATLVQASTAQP